MQNTALKFVDIAEFVYRDLQFKLALQRAKEIKKREIAQIKRDINAVKRIFCIIKSAFKLLFYISSSVFIFWRRLSGLNFLWRATRLGSEGYYSKEAGNLT